jgi:hypothetical protein
VPAEALFGASVVFGLLAWGIVAARYIWPHLRDRRRIEALRPLLILHSFRFVGLAFLVPGVVAPELPAAFARPAAYGDLIAAALALAGIGRAAQQVGPVLGVGVQPLGHCRSSLRFLSGRRRRACPGSVGCRLFHYDCPSTAAPDHARTCVSALAQARRCPRTDASVTNIVSLKGYAQATEMTPRYREPNTCWRVLRHTHGRGRACQ